jgi:YHS domain-containing protein
MNILTPLSRWVIRSATLLLMIAGCTLTNQTTANDPVCGVEVAKQNAITRHYDDWDYYFDSEGCARKFDAHPARYVEMSHYVLNPRD